MSEYGVNGAHQLADLQPSGEELEAVLDVLDEVEAEEAAGLLDDDDELPDDGFGLWQDSDGTPDYIPDYSIEGLSADLDRTQGSEAQRQLEDDFPLARSSEGRMAQALDSVSRGTYTPGTMYRPAAPSSGCGPADDFGRCGSRFHDATCESADLAAAASGGGESSDAWRRTLLRGAQISRDLDEAYEQLDDPGPAHEALMQELGLS